MAALTYARRALLPKRCPGIMLQIQITAALCEVERSLSPRHKLGRFWCVSISRAPPRDIDQRRYLAQARKGLHVKASSYYLGFFSAEALGSLIGSISSSMIGYSRLGKARTSVYKSTSSSTTTVWICVNLG